MTTWKDGGNHGLLCREITDETGDRAIARVWTKRHAEHRGGGIDGTWKVGPGYNIDAYTVHDDEGWYVMSCQDEQRAQLIASAPELAEALQGLLWEIVTMSDMINREDPGMMDAIKNHEFETDHVRACQRARELLIRLGMTGPPSKGGEKK